MIKSRKNQQGEDISMFKKMKGILLMSLVSATAWTQGPSLSFVIPEQNQFATSLSQYRYGGKTEAGNLLTLNGATINVYPNGAFAGLLNLAEGKNQFEFIVTNSLGEKTTRIFEIERKAPMQSTADNVLALESEMLLPDRSYSPMPGDSLSLRVKGTPRAKVAAHIKGYKEAIPMVELTPEMANGLKGIYTGSVTFLQGDEIQQSQVEFRLSKDNLGETTRVSPETITVSDKQWPRVGIVNGEGAYLIAGTGEARLGGAQLGLLASSTRLVLDGKIGSLYRVRLTPQLHALISESSLQLQPQGYPLPSVILGGGTVQHQDKWDEVVLPTTDKIPVLLEAEMNPPRLKAHLYGATSNLTWITNLLPLNMINNIDWQQAEDNHLIILLDLKNPPVWGYDYFFQPENGDLHIRVRKKPLLGKTAKSPLQGLKVALDSGHGGNNSGALGSTGLRESECNFAIINYLAAELRKKGAEVILVKPEDVNIPLAERRKTALNAGADILLSVHNNSIAESGDPLTNKGSMTLYRHAINRSLAEAIHQRLIQVPGLSDSGIVSSFNFYLTKHTEIPSVLMETAFMSNPEDEMFVGNPQGQKAIAQAIAKGLIDYIRMDK
jgi:N-acetylmuramoyl-L-alanine amidase